MIKSSVKSKTITIENIGPIQRLAIPLPEAGVVVLRGRNGVGKSHALAAVDSLVSGRGRPPCRDGAAHGAVEGFGARLTIGRSTRRTGEAEVLTLEGRLDISQLVQPPIKDEEAADRQRIKALIQLSGKPADVTAFEDILPEGISLGELVPPQEQEEDPVVLSAKVKRALESEARRWEKRLEEARAAIAVLQSEIGDIDQDDDLWRRVLHQPEVVRAEAEREVTESLFVLHHLEAKHEAAIKHSKQIESAKAALAELEAGELAVPEKIDSEIADLDDKIRKLEHALAAAKERRTQLALKRKQAAEMQRRLAELRKIVSQEVETVSDEELQLAQARLEQARKQHAAVVDLVHKADAWTRLAKLQTHVAEAEAFADTLRDAARATDDVLSDMVASVTSRLRVEEGRLVCDTDRGAEPFGELSPGERWRIALEIAVEQLGRGGIVTVPQEAWESLDPINRQEITQIAKDVGVVILTAEASEQEQIAAEVAT